MVRQDRHDARVIENTRSDLWDLDIRLDKHVRNSEIGLFSRHVDSIQIYAVLVKEHDLHPHEHPHGELALRHRRIEDESENDDHVGSN